MAWGNWKAGRTDRVGAWRLAVLIASGAFATCLLAAHYNSFQNFNRALSNWLSVSVFVGVLFGTMYLAFEPHVRKRWPEMLVGWARLFSGRLTDPLVGRHVLYGVAGAMVAGLLGGVSNMAEKNLRLDPLLGDLQALTGVRFHFATLASLFANTIGSATFMVFLLLGLRVLLRNQWLALVATASIFAAMAALNSALPWFVFGITFLLNGLMLVYLLRFGYLATVVVLMCNYFMGHFPPDVHWDNWYAPSGTLCVLFLAFLTAYGYRVSKNEKTRVTRGNRHARFQCRDVGDTLGLLLIAALLADATGLHIRFDFHCRISFPLICRERFCPPKQIPAQPTRHWSHRRKHFPEAAMMGNESP
jgi:hypothetical protein